MYLPYVTRPCPTWISVLYYKFLSYVCRVYLSVLRVYLSYITSPCPTYVVYNNNNNRCQTFNLTYCYKSLSYVSYITSPCPTYVVYNNYNNRCQTFNLSYYYKSLSNVYIYLSYVTSPCPTCPMIQVPVLHIYLSYVWRMSLFYVFICFMNVPVLRIILSFVCPVRIYICLMQDLPVLRFPL